ncbi:hypothetical protein ACUOE0_003451 [Vibrio vulnificus]
MTWINLPSVSVQSGSKTVTVSNAQTTHIKVGDALLIGNYQPVEISGVFATQLTLRENWSNAAQTNVVAVVMPTSGDFVTATKVLKEATETTRSNFAALEKWATQMGTVEFKGQDNTPHTGRTFKQMDADVADLEAQASNLIINVSGRGFARSEADMLAMRAANSTKFAASGFVHFGKHYQGLNVNEGLWTPANSPNECFIGRSSSNLAGTSDTDSAVINLAGFMVRLSLRADYGRFTVKFPDAPDGTVTYDSATGAVVKHPDAATAFASETATNKVVTERVDLAGLDGYLEQITPDKPYIYPYGCIQSQATTVDGIATTVDNIRPITYFAVFDGDESSRGRGWNINTLTDAQKEKIFSNPDHNIFRMNNGDLVQFRVRQRTIAGAGNGDWANFDTTKSSELNFGGVYTRVSVQGARDSIPTYSTAYPYISKLTTTESYVSKTDPALFYARKLPVNDNCAYNGECYFYVLATVLRLNHGAYHPSSNPLGTTLWRDKTGGNGGGNWNAPFVGSPSSRSDCFFYYALDSSPYTQPGALANHGAIGKLSGHPEGKFYDAIYPDGQGGVIDRRLSAFPITMEDYFKAMTKAENGSMRGIEKLKNTFVIDGDAVPTKPPMFTLGGDSWTYFPVGVKWQYRGNNSTHGAPLGRNGYAIYSDGSVYSVIVYSDTSLNIVWEGQGNLNAELLGKDLVNIVFSEYTNLSVSGNFLQTDVIGDPATILQVEALKTGWIGNWIPVMPDGTSKFYELTRKSVISSSGSVSGTRVYTSDLGTSWSGSSLSFTDATLNGYTAGHASDLVVIMNYTAAAKVTKPSAVLPVYGSRSGLGDVLATISASNSYGNLLAESCLGKVLTYGGLVGRGAQKLGITAYLIKPDGSLYSDPIYGQVPTHQPISLAVNGSITQAAIKVLPHAASINGQATLGFVWNELKHDGEDWGDDGTMRVIGNTGTYNNLNGESCLYGYAVTALPIGWVDNHARFGAQVPGVDL